MAYYAKVGSFNIDTTKTLGQTQAITGIEFQPKIVLFWWSGSTATGDSIAGGTYSFGFGAAISSSSRFCAIGISEDALEASSNLRRHSNAACIMAYTDAATLDGIADFYSADANGFTLIIDDQFTQAYRISFLALGGDDLTNVYIGNKALPGVTGNYNITGVGFQPDAVLIAGALIGAAGSGESIHWALGWATSSSEQGTVSVSSIDNQSTTNTYCYGYNNEVHSAYMASGALGMRNSFVSFGTDGFTLNLLEGTGFTWAYYYFVCLKGGQYLVGDLTTRTDSNDIEEDVGFEPVAILFASVNRALSTQDTVSDHARMSIGAASAVDERAVQAISDEDNLADTETAYANYDTAVYAHVKDDAIEALMDLKSSDADGFTCVMDDVETAGCWVTYLAIGAPAAAGVPRQMDYYRRQRV